MTDYYNVLIAVDLDGEPEQVLARALALIDQSADVHIVNVAFDPTYVYANYVGAVGFMKEPSVSIKDQVKISALEQLNKLVEESGLQRATPNC